jgi:hypothetical protein
VLAAPAIAAVLAYRAVAVWLPAAMGLSSLGRLRGSVAGWRRGTADAGGYGLAAPTTCISHR